VTEERRLLLTWNTVLSPREDALTFNAAFSSFSFGEDSQVLLCMVTLTVILTHSFHSMIQTVITPYLHITLIERICGVDKDVVDYPYVYFPILNNTYLNYSVCVKRCPTNDDLTISCAGTKNIPACVDKAPIIVETFEEQTITLPNEDSDDEEPKTQTVTVFTGYHPEPFKIYNSRVMFNKVCTPDIKEDMRDSFALETTNSWIEDLNNTWDVIAGSLILSIVLGYDFHFLEIIAKTSLPLYHEIRHDYPHLDYDPRFNYCYCYSRLGLLG